MRVSQIFLILSPYSLDKSSILTPQLFTDSAKINLGFKFSGVTWTVSDTDLNMGFATDDNKYCYGGVAYMVGVDLWILGDIFRKLQTPLH